MIRIAPRLQQRTTLRASREVGPGEPVEPPEGAALTALLAAQVAAYEVVDSEARLAVADDWIAAHDGSDRRWEEALRRRSRIETQRVIQLRMCWTACVALYEALGAITTPDSWMAANAPEIDTQAAEGIWQSLMGERLIPVGVRYPADDAPLPGWMRDELHARRTACATGRTTRGGDNMSAFVCGDLVRVAGFDDLGRELSGMTGRIETLTPLYANVRLTSWPGEAVRVERETLTLISAREIRPEPVTVVVESARRRRRQRPQIVSVVPPETVYPEPEYRAGKPVSRLREKLRARSRD